MRRKKKQPILLYVLGGFGLLLFLMCGGLLVVGAFLPDDQSPPPRTQAEIEAEVDATIAAKKEQAEIAVAKMKEQPWFKELEAKAKKGEVKGSMVFLESESRYVMDPDNEWEGYAKSEVLRELSKLNESVREERRRKSDVRYGLDATDREMVFRDLVRLEDRHGYGSRMYELERKALERKHNLTHEQATQIMVEGNEKKWPMP